MGQDFALTFFIKLILLLIFLLVSIENSYGQSIHESENILTESKEIEEEIIQKINSKMSIDEFINDEDIHLNFISKVQVDELKNHIKETGNLLDLLELESIEGFTFTDYLRLSSIITIELNPIKNTKNKIQSTSKSIYTSKIDDSYEGGHWGLYQQVKIGLKNDLKIGFALENDVGEKYDGLQFDHFSYFVNKTWKNNEINIGEYQIYQGFGLLIGQGFSSSFGSGGINNFVQQKWLGNASQTEINLFNGLYYRKYFKKHIYSIGISKGKTDVGTNTGYHRTINEISNKNKIEEKVILLGFEQKQRLYFSKCLFVFDAIDKKHGISIGIQKYYRNTISFLEFAQFDSRYAYTAGIMLQFYNTLQVNISNSYFQTKYSTPWQSNSSQGFSESDGKGLTLNISFPIKHLMTINYTYKSSKKIEINELEYGEKLKLSHTLRIDKRINKNISNSGILIFQGNTLEEKNIRSKFSLKLNSSETIQQEYQFYANFSSSNLTNALSYTIKIKFKQCSIGGSVASINTNSKSPIYYNIDNVSVGRQTIGVFHSGIVQSFGVQSKLFRKIKFSIFYQNVINSIDGTSMFKINTSLKYQ